MTMPLPKPWPQEVLLSTAGQFLLLHLPELSSRLASATPVLPGHFTKTNCQKEDRTAKVHGERMASTRWASQLTWGDVRRRMKSEQE